MLDYLLRFIGVSLALLLLLLLAAEVAPGVMNTFTYPPWTMALGLFVLLFLGHLAALVLYGIRHLFKRPSPPPANGSKPDQGHQAD